MGETVDARAHAHIVCMVSVQRVVLVLPGTSIPSNSHSRSHLNFLDLVVLFTPWMLEVLRTCLEVWKHSEILYLRGIFLGTLMW